MGGVVALGGVDHKQAHIAHGGGSEGTVDDVVAVGIEHVEGLPFLGLTVPSL